MKDDIPHSDPYPDEPLDDFDMDEEAIPDYPPDDDYQHYDDAWDGPISDPPADPDQDDPVDASIYDPPPPPVKDDEIANAGDGRPPGNDGGWLKSNLWKLVIIIVLVVVIIFLLARACGSGSKEKPVPTAVPSPTTQLLPTFTPTPAGGEVLPTTELGTGEQPPVAPVETSEPPSSGDQLAINQTVEVTGTGKNKLSFRAGPGTDYKIIRLIKDGTRLTIIGGPKEADDYTWWQMKTEEGQVGWAVEDFLKPVKE